MKLLKILFINLVILLACLELGSFLYYNLGLSISNYTTSYVSKTYDNDLQWMTEHNNWGAWHVPNGRAHMERRCFGVELISNSYGARDIERNMKSEKSRVLVLGDSFVEGYGVNREKRFTDLLEKKLGREFLNFGTSGSSGPTQYAILYRELASKFDHDEVLIAFLPDNDFTDNDPAIWLGDDKTAFNIRYRPYWKRVDGTNDFEVFYPTDKPKHMVTFGDYRSENQQKGPSLKSRIQRLFWTYGVYREIRYISRGSTYDDGIYSGYFDGTDEQVDAALFFLKKIKDMAGDKKVSMISIARPNDLKRQAETPSPIIARLSAFAAENDIKFVDLAPETLERETDIKSLYLPCDGHWSPKGHQLAADIIANTIFNQ
ncbi:MAG: SGNH/GDSL hydrolase family protein [Methylocystaceae bacterium]|nr:SGNH/GDSL hydrolase family protein [Methylocystaceae bacterium]